MMDSACHFRLLLSANFYAFLVVSFPNERNVVIIFLVRNVGQGSQMSRQAGVREAKTFAPRQLKETVDVRLSNDDSSDSSSRTNNHHALDIRQGENVKSQIIRKLKEYDDRDCR
jgi:hypothetical protein